MAGRVCVALRRDGASEGRWWLKSMSCTRSPTALRTGLALQGVAYCPAWLCVLCTFVGGRRTANAQRVLPHSRIRAWAEWCRHVFLCVALCWERAQACVFLQPASQRALCWRFAGRTDAHCLFACMFGQAITSSLPAKAASDVSAQRIRDYHLQTAGVRGSRCALLVLLRWVGQGSLTVLPSRDMFHICGFPDGGGGQ